MMRRHTITHRTLTLGALLLLATVAPALADDYERCPEDAAKCVEMMAKKLRDRGWLGINFEMDKETGVVSLTAVVPDSPAEAAGLEAGDVLVSVNGVAYSEGNEEAVKKIYSEWKPGDEASIVASRGGVESEHVVTLGKLPEHILAQWIGHHMLEGHLPAPEPGADEAEPADK